MMTNSPIGILTPHGTFVATYSQTGLSRLEFPEKVAPPKKDPALTGLAKRWSVDGWKQAEGNYRNGLQDGRWKMWWDNGLLRSAVFMKSGNAEGAAKYWYKNGQFEKEGNWIKGKFVATAKWNEAGESIPVE